MGYVHRIKTRGGCKEDLEIGGSPDIKTNTVMRLGG